MPLSTFASLVSLTALAGAVGCSSSGPAGGADAGEQGGADGGAGDNQGTLPAVPAQAGVAYLVHYHDSSLRSYRLDGTLPAPGPVLELDEVSNNMALDPENDLLAIASDVGREVTLVALSRPSAPEDALDAPEIVGKIDMDKRPVFVRLHPYRHRLYVVVNPADSGPLTEMELWVYDVSEPATPVQVEGSPHTIPVTVSLALDPVRDVLFVVGLTTDELYGYDLQGDRFEALPGDPIDLIELYPEENQFSFQARRLTADPFRNRLYAARSQSALSEVIAFEYPPDIPRGGARYGQFAGMDDLVKLDDPFDVSVPVGDRANLLDGYQPVVDLERGDLFLSARAWNGDAASAFVLGLSAELELRENCDAYEGFGCWVRGHAGGEPQSYLQTDGSLCVDYTNRVVVATSVATGSEGSPGRAHLFRYESDLTMSPWLTEEGSDLAAGALPVTAACH